MNRFWVFPLALGVAFALGITLADAEMRVPRMFAYSPSLFYAPFSLHYMWLSFLVSAPS